MGKRLADTACDDTKGVDILLVHDPRAATESLARGCARLALSGHTHHEYFQTVSDETGNASPQLTGGSAGGAERDRPTLGPLLADAHLYVLRLDRASKQASAYQPITVTPDASVVLGTPVYLRTSNEPATVLNHRFR
jgi:hypothetical protein